MTDISKYYELIVDHDELQQKYYSIKDNNTSLIKENNKLNIYKNKFEKLDKIFDQILENPEKLKNIKRCGICYDYIIDDKKTCFNKKCNMTYHSECLKKTKFEGKKCIYCFSSMKIFLVFPN